jgi:nitroreductase
MTRRNVFLGGGAAVILGLGAAYAVVRDMGSLAEYEAAVAVTRATLHQTPEIGEFLRYATLAPSGHNTQPWTFRVDGNRIDILPDFSRRTPIVDPDDHHLFVSLGCAGENLALACAARGRPGELRFDSSNGGSAALELGNGAANPSALFDAIPRRQSSRDDYDGKPVSNAEIRTLTASAAVPGVDLVLVIERPQIDRIRDLVIAGNSMQMADKAFVRELRSWMRFSPREALRTGDGLFSATTGNPILPAWLGPAFFDLAFKARAENDKYARQIASSAGIAVFVAQKEDHEHWVLAGRAAERFALQATALGLKCAFVNQPVEVASLRPELANLIGMPGRRPDLVMRYGYGPGLPYSARRPIEGGLRL